MRFIKYKYYELIKENLKTFLIILNLFLIINLYLINFSILDIVNLIFLSIGISLVIFLIKNFFLKYFNVFKEN